MNFPTHITVRGVRYTIRQRDHNTYGDRGYVSYPFPGYASHYAAGPRIVLYRRPPGGPEWPAAKRRETFWHELTHAVLNAYPNDSQFAALRSDERFVERFARTLSQAIDSAEF